MNDIFDRISIVGLRLTLEIILEGLSVHRQDEEEASYFSRRKPEDSEITIDELTSQSSLYLYNKIRMLQDPYPNPYIVTSDGKKLVVKQVVVTS